MTDIVESPHPTSDQTVVAGEQQRNGREPAEQHCEWDERLGRPRGAVGDCSSAGGLCSGHRSVLIYV